MNDESAEQAQPTGEQACTDGIRLLNTEQLFEGHREVCIQHGGAIYRLRITKSDKLILNK